ncbi:MAG: MotE family protein [Nitrospirales bacterium]
MKKSPSRTILPSWKIIPWWMVVILLWGTAVWSVQETNHESDADYSENQAIETTLTDEIPTEELTLLEQLQARLKAVEERERELQIREERVAALQRDVEALAARQSKEAQRLGSQASALKEEQQEFLAQDPALDHLIKIYESMDPEEAALRIEQMKEGLALDLLASIKGKKAAALLAGVSPLKAARLSEGLRRHRESKLQERADAKPKK